MLNFSDFMFLPKHLKNKVENKNKAVIVDDKLNLFSDVILETISRQF